MRYYAACVDDIGIMASTATYPKRILLSFFYYKNNIKKVKECISKNFDVFLDSGAFSAMSQKKTIDIDEYCEFIKESGVPFYASLDVIGDAKQTLENHHYMIKKHNLSPIPAFHMGSRIEDLDIILRFNHVALGGLVFSSGIESHCDEVWNYILRKSKNIRVHGFGISNPNFISKYPWFSIDSSSFQACRRFGRQNLLINGSTFKSYSEDEFLTYLENVYMYDKKELLENNKKRIYLEDFFAVNSIKRYVENISIENKYNNFGNLTSQLKLF